MLWRFTVITLTRNPSLGDLYYDDLGGQALKHTLLGVNKSLTKVVNRYIQNKLVSLRCMKSKAKNISKLQNKINLKKC